MSLGPTLERAAQSRTAVRYKLQLPVIFHWNNGQEHTEGGFTSDVALDGALILCSKLPPTGSAVRVEIFFPHQIGAARTFSLSVRGK